jgi:glycosyltransferase involved in cell wall biosynthesis
MEAANRIMSDTRTPTVSIIIPAYNTAGLIGQCLESVLSQTYADFEALVVNDGSPDTPELEKALAPFMDRIVYIKQENKRAAGARNTAIRQAKGEFLAFLDSDDGWLRHHLASQMKKFADDPSLDLVYANGIRIANPRRQVEFMERCPSYGTANFEALVVERCQISVSTVVVRKSAIVKAGGFDESLLRCDDYDMWLRAAFHGAKIGYGREVQARLNGGRPGSLGSSRVKMLEAYCLILDKALRTLPLSDAQHKLVSTRMSQIKAANLIEEGKLQLNQGRFEKARELFSEANKSVRQWKITLALLGLDIAPQATCRLIFAWNRVLNGFSALS